MVFVVLPVAWNSVAPHLMNLVTTAVFTDSQTELCLSVCCLYDDCISLLLILSN